jgi:hypothetical protein
MPRLIAEILLGIIAVAALGVFMPKMVESHSASNLITLTIAEDSFRNYDFVGQVDDPNGVDWPVTMVFGTNASQGKVEFGYENQGVPCCLGSIKYARVNDGGWAWYSVRGIKDALCNGASKHLRHYGGNGAQGRFLNGSWGYYVLGTTHFDHTSGCFNEYESGDNEQAEEWFALKAKNQWGTGNVIEDWAFFHNFEQRRTEVHPGTDHTPDNNGYATWVGIN